MEFQASQRASPEMRRMAPHCQIKINCHSPRSAILRKQPGTGGMLKAIAWSFFVFSSPIPAPLAHPRLATAHLYYLWLNTFIHSVDSGEFALLKKGRKSATNNKTKSKRGANSESIHIHHREQQQR